jgi:hypothetical protein
MGDRFDFAARQPSLLDEMLRAPRQGWPTFGRGTLEDAMPLIVEHHYTARRTADPMFVFLWRYGNEPVAAAVFTSPVNRYFGKGAVELARLVRLPDFAMPLSRFVAQCLRWLKANTKLKYCLSYADTTVGHCGFIYQACNFIFVARSRGNVQYRHAGTGKIVSGRSFDQQTTKAGWERLRTGEKLLYVFPLAERRAALLSRFRWSPLPYPKSVAGAANAAA